MRSHLFLLSVILCTPACAQQNTTIESFQKAKEIALNQVYFDHRETFYCGAEIKEDKTLILPAGFQTEKFQKRANRLEWEHVVPAENFGRAFIEWREGDPQCIDTKGKFYKGRKCADKMNKQYRYMQADLYNLYPAIGAVNAARSNKQFTMLSEVKNTFGTCPMKIKQSKVEPPDAVKGTIARTYLYMQEAYQPTYHMNASMEKLMQVWDEKFPPDAWECERAQRIQKIQGNENQFVKDKCPKN